MSGWQWKRIRQLQLVRCPAPSTKAARARRAIPQTSEANFCGHLSSFGFRPEFHTKFYVGFQLCWAFCDVRGVSKGLADTI